MDKQKLLLQQEVQLWTELIDGWERAERRPAPPQLWEALDFAKKKLQRHSMFTDWLEAPEEETPPEAVLH